MQQQLTATARNESLTLGTWLNFMVGRRDAIETVAKSRNALWVGLLFVLSAGLAREYDGEYLVREPWYLLLPLVASLATSLVLYTLIYWSARNHQVQLQWWPGYRTFLTFYWMTAPLAWLYALPVERLLDPGPATAVNFGLLAIVSLWRVLLITRAISVWLDAGYLRVLLLVLFFGNTVLLAANFATPTPVWDVMGGIRLPERETVILNAKLMVWGWGAIAWFLLLIIVGGTAAFGRKAPWYLGELPKPFEFRTARSTWGFAILLLVTGLGILPLAQPEQARGWQAEHLLHSGKIEEAVAYMSATPRSKFPPQWDPPPRVSYGENQPPVEDVFAAINKHDAPAWIRDVYLEKVLESRSGLPNAIDSAANGEPARLVAILDFLERSGSIKSNYDIKWRLQQAVEGKKVDAALRERIRKLLGMNAEKSQEASG